MTRIFDPKALQAARVTDAERVARLQRYGEQLEKLVLRDREQFRPQYAVAVLGIDPDDRAEALERVYELAVRRTYGDHAITDRERRALDWLAARLELDDEHRRAAERRAMCEVFEGYLEHALTDGAIETVESRTLHNIAAGLGSSVDSLIQTYFADRGERFLRALFAAILRDGDISDQEWSRLTHAADGLGVTHERLLSIIGGQAERYIEQLLRDAEASGAPVNSIVNAIDSLVRRLPLSPKFRKQLEERMNRADSSRQPPVT